LSNIQISGGSTSNRQYISTTEFNLARFLLTLDIDINEIYRNYTYSKMMKDPKNTLNTKRFEFPKSSLIHYISSQILKLKNISLETVNKLEESLVPLNNSILLHKKEIAIIENNIKPNLDQLSPLWVQGKGKGKKNLKSSEAQIAIHNDSIYYLKSSVVDIESQITDLKSKILNMDKELEDLNNLSYIALKELYYKQFHNSNITDSAKYL
jgi:hypothetical protein